MKRLLIILSLFMLTGVSLFAQQEDNDNGNEKIRDKMSQYIQERLSLSKSEAEKFSPVFLRYFRDWRTTLRESKGEPVLLRQQKIVDLRVRYRDQFKQIIGEKRSNEVFDHQQRFIQGIKDLQRERLEKNGGDRPRKFR
ncbi:MAG: hypothetical protein JWM28_1842 [Chitinophagaceae bacterium]|nr:hypothetical protein [Chitinophagaceae bacterium]